MRCAGMGWRGWCGCQVYVWHTIVYMLHETKENCSDILNCDTKYLCHDIDL